MAEPPPNLIMKYADTKTAAWHVAAFKVYEKLISAESEACMVTFLIYCTYCFPLSQHAYIYICIYDG